MSVLQILTLCTADGADGKSKKLSAFQNPSGIFAPAERLRVLGIF